MRLQHEEIELLGVCIHHSLSLFFILILMIMFILKVWIIFFSEDSVIRMVKLSSLANQNISLFLHNRIYVSASV